MPVFELGNAKVTDLCAPASTQEHVGRLQVPAEPPSPEGLVARTGQDSFSPRTCNRIDSFCSRGSFGMLPCAVSQGAPVEDLWVGMVMQVSQRICHV